MRALPLAILLLTAGITLAPDASARDCGGIVDADCDSTYCTFYTPDGCLQREDVHCLVYADPTRVSGGDENTATVVCYLLDGPALGGDCQDPADALCQRTVCAELSHDGCMRYEQRTCILYVNGFVAEVTDLTCLPLDGTRPLRARP